MAGASDPLREAPSDDGAPNRRVAALVAFHQRRKQDSRDRLLAAAMRKFCELGYLSVSVEDIAADAGISRMTFYRHFSGKADLAAALFKATSSEAMPCFLRIATQDFNDPAVVRAWIGSVFTLDAANRGLLRVFTQATADEDGFTERAQEFIADLIRGLGASIPAFAADPGIGSQRRRWMEAWLLLYEILDQSNHAALSSGIATDPLMVEILADRFTTFACVSTPAPETSRA